MPKVKNLPDRDLLGPLMKKFRKRAGLTQTDVAGLLGLAEGALGQIENNFKRAQPWHLDMLSYIYGLTPYEGWQLFYEAGYSLYDQPPVISSILRTYSNLPPNLQNVANHVLEGAVELLAEWEAHTGPLGDPAAPRVIPTAEQVESYWQERATSRYHSRRIDTSQRIAAGPKSHRRS